VYISPTWGDAPLEPIVTKFGNLLYLTKLINRSQFGVDWFGSFGSGEVQNVPFPIGTTSGPYHCSVTALARDQKEVQIMQIIEESANTQNSQKYFRTANEICGVYSAKTMCVNDKAGQTLIEKDQIRKMMGILL